jgi:hypothetical protein
MPEKGKRQTDNHKRAEIIKKKIADPSYSIRQAVKEFKVSDKTVMKLYHETPDIMSNDEHTKRLVTANNYLIQLADEKIRQKMELDDNVRIWELVQVKKLALDQNRVVQWEPTEIHKVDITNMDKMSNDEIEEIIKNILNNADNPPTA